MEHFNKPKTQPAYLDSDEGIAIFKHVCCLPPLCHDCDFFELFYVMEGSCENFALPLTQSTASNIISPQGLQKGDFCILSPQTALDIDSFSNDFVLYRFLIRTSLFDITFLGILSENAVLSNFFTHALYSERQNPYLLFHTGENSSLRDFIDYIYGEFTEPKKYRRLMMNNLLHAIFVILLRDHENDVVLPPNPAVREDNLIHILNHIQENYARLTLSGLAKFFNYSERHMSRLIKENTGLSFSELIRNLKLQRSADLLKTTKLTPAEIAECVGYFDLSSFYRTFKAHYHMTPIEYRKS
ncbi:helix-turn-helix transcriptional regulator [Konateibacter massiliensis]|uniref:helix-turn-helix transcriptional regulator n=1 Tax=Konateibacter massiliensis TaxID=2002841 RepID=UPI000C15C0C4|nr:helix-turn-helix transcriptional regulator [Konateibacter massiliensis]